MTQANRTLIFGTLLFCFALTTYGQVQPPNLICISNDTLKWELPTNNCGAFNSYIIYRSNNITGPFNVLTNITDSNQSEFFDDDAFGNTFFYYMESDFNCPGETVLASDTLNNRNPEVSSINYVTANEIGQVEINWNPSPSPEVFAYLIFKNTDVGTVIIDTVFNDNTYLDVNANTDTQIETYFVNGIDQCGNSSIFDDPHNTIFLESQAISECEQSIDLEWNLYQNWPNGISRQEILVSINGNDFFVFQTLDGNQTTFTYNQLNDLDEYCFFIRAVDEASGFSSNSNIICQTVDIIQPATDVVITNVSVVNESEVQVSWHWDTSSELNSYRVQRSNDNTNFSAITEEFPSTNLSESNVYDDTNIDVASGPLTYRIETTDACDTIAISNQASSIFLTATALTGGQNQLAWTPYINTNAVINTYEIHRITDGVDEVIGAVDPSQTFYSDQIDVSSSGGASPCYYILAVSDYWLPNGPKIVTESLSNQACVTQQAQVFVPNAFVPDGINNIFRPILQFGAPSEYTMLIYDRWGGQVFESTSIDTGWDGTTGGDALPQGVYAYYIQVIQGGTTTEVTGTVLLLR